MTSLATSNNKDEQVRQPDFGKVKTDVRRFMSSLSVYDFVNPDKPWILVPNGSFMGFFDFVPPVFREGPWAILPCIYVFAAIYLVVFGAVYNYATKGIQDLPRAYYEAFTIPWFMNLAGFLWTCYVYSDLFVSGLGLAALTTFTVQSYTLIMLRFLLSALVPFCPVLAVCNELLRYPILSQATITFTVWNFVLAPAIFLCIKDPEKRKGFIKYFTSFRLTQLHFFHIFLAAFSGVLGTPPRCLQWTDLYASVTLGLQYCLFYIFVLDRLGIHFYMIFSPRTNLALPAWSLVIATTIGLYPIWSSIIEHYGGFWEEQSWNTTWWMNYSSNTTDTNIVNVGVQDF